MTTNQQTAEEKQLIARLLARDDAAFEQVVREYYPSMYAVAAAIIGHALADEVVQEAWFSVLGALPRFEGRSKLKSWIIRIVANEAKSRLRKESRSVSLEAINESWATDPRFAPAGHWHTPLPNWESDTPADLLAAEQLRDCLKMRMAELPDNQKTILNLRDMSGLEMAEICNILEVSSSNARVLLHRARDKMLRVIDKFQRLGEC